MQFKFRPVLILSILSFGVVLTGCGGSSPTANGTPSTDQAALSLPYPSVQPSAVAGQEVFTANCVPCHGEQGDGTGPAGAGLDPRPRDFTDLTFMRKEKPGELFEKVNDGMGAMPAWKDALSEEDRWNALYYVWDFSTDASRLDAGRAVFESRCVNCHGTAGKGDGPAGSFMKPQPRNFTDLGGMQQVSREMLFQSLTEGKGAMPPFKDLLTEEERWSVIDYVWTFAYDSVHVSR